MMPIVVATDRALQIELRPKLKRRESMAGAFSSPCRFVKMATFDRKRDEVNAASQNQLESNLMFVFVVGLICLSPLFGVFVAAYFFLQYKAAPEPKRHLSLLFYTLSIIAAATGAWFIGTYGGIYAACRLPSDPGNLCGLFGYFVYGPLLVTATMIVYAKVLTTRARNSP